MQSQTAFLLAGARGKERALRPSKKKSKGKGKKLVLLSFVPETHDNTGEERDDEDN